MLILLLNLKLLENGGGGDMLEEVNLEINKVIVYWYFKKMI